jgi:LPXTG-site transpeptidase (sortase) family protein
MRRHLERVLFAGGLLLASWPAITWAYGVYWQDRLAREWPTPRASPAATPRPAGATSKPARTVHGRKTFARLRIPRIGLDAIVVDDVDAASLRRGPGHLPETSLPGERGNCAVAAHRDAWFARLPELRPGDLVRLNTPDGGYEYRVVEKRVVEPHRTDLLAPRRYPALTLITCTGPRQPRSRYRLLVFCRLKAVRPEL